MTQKAVVSWDVQQSIKANEALIIARQAIGGKEYSATYAVTPKGDCDLSDNSEDTDTLPNDECWPTPPTASIKEAAELAKGWEGIGVGEPERRMI